MPQRLVRPAYARPHRLRDAWRTASTAHSWTFPADWWAPAVDAVTEALLAGRDVESACTELGRSRSAIGAGLGETLDDVGVLRDFIHDDRLLAQMIRAAALGWAETTCEALASTTCEDPLSLLSTPAYLRTRLGELYREAERTSVPLERTHALVVVALPTSREWDAMTRPLHVGESLRAVFSGGETLCALSSSRTVAVVDRDALLGERIAALRTLLSDRLGTDPELVIRVWVEGLPPTLEAAYLLLADLRR
ncbi:MAG TPA: hypothetical protein VHC49_23155 [Mycobacteriales bacterium]|nr:hypothetical protein [Mycobacteriales bacterium]